MAILPERLSKWKEECWPHLLSEGYKVSSVQTWTYNCIAFAAGDEGVWWWPDPDGDGYWPEGIKREESLECFELAYGTLGYEKCDPGPEPGFEKIVIYVHKGKPSHAARQLPDGRWKSKLGSWEDIEHNTERAVEEYEYGKATLYMKRPSQIPLIKQHKKVQ